MGFKNICIGFLLAVTVAFPATAWKSATHVWVGEQVIQDIQDGYVTIDVGGNGLNYKVDEAIANAIKANPKAYRMGNIGPDASPDMLFGQMLIHPGAGMPTGAWAKHLLEVANLEHSQSIMMDIDDHFMQAKTQCQSTSTPADITSLVDDFMKLIFDGDDESSSFVILEDEITEFNAEYFTNYKAPQINPQDIAYSYGFLGHIAGDVFGHTFINTYAGDTFSFMDKDTDPNHLVEKRHSAMEAYMDKHLPDLIDPNIQWNVTDSTAWIGNSDEFPAEFLVDAFILNRNAYDIYKYDPSAAHFVFFNNLYHFSRQVGESCLWTYIEREVIKAIVEYYLTYRPTDAQADAIGNGVGEVNDAMVSTLEEANRVYKNLYDVESTLRKGAIDANSELLTELKRINDNITNLIADATTKSLKISSKLVKQTCPLECEDSAKGWGAIALTGGASCVAKAVCSASDTAHNALIDSIDSQLTECNEKLSGHIISVTNNFHNEIDKGMDKYQEKTENVVDQVVKILNIPLKGELIVFQTHFQTWARNIRNGMIEYVRANKKMMSNTMLKHIDSTPTPTRECWKGSASLDLSCLRSGDSAMQPLTEWWADHNILMLTGIDPVLMDSAGNVIDTLNKATADINGTITKATDAIHSIIPGYDNIFADINEKLNSLTNKAINKAESEVLTVILGEQHETLTSIMRGDVNGDNLNEVFAEDSKTKGLLVFDDFESEYKKLLKIKSNGVIDTDKFSPLKNTLQLAKLSLLSGEQLCQVAEDSMGGNFDSYSGLYDGPYATDCLAMLNEFGDEYMQNIITSSVKNIDGHEQWKPQASPLPRRNDYYARDEVYQANSTGYGEFEERFGYDLNGADGHGFWLWQHPVAQEKVFPKLFTYHQYGENNFAYMVPIINLILF